MRVEASVYIRERISRAKSQEKAPTELLVHSSHDTWGTATEYEKKYVWLELGRHRIKVNRADLRAALTATSEGL